MNLCEVTQSTDAYYERMSENELAYERAYAEYVYGSYSSGYPWVEERLPEYGSFALGVAEAIKQSTNNAELGALVRALAQQAICQAADWYASNKGSDEDNAPLPKFLITQAS